MNRTKALGLVSAAAVIALTACSNPSNDPAPAGASGHGAGGEASSQKIVAGIKTDSAMAGMLPPDVKSKGSISAAINADVQPIKFIDSSGQMAGLDPDILRSAGKLLGVTVDFQQAPFDSQVPGLEAHRFDLIASAGDFVERQTHIDFIDYLQSGTAILVGKDFKEHSATPEQLCGDTVGYVRGTAQQGFLSAASAKCTGNGKPAIQINGYGDANSGVLAVQSGQAQAFWGDLSPMLYNVQKSPDRFKIVYKEKTSHYGIGVSKDDPKLRDALRGALLKLAQDGTYSKLLNAWGQQGYGLPSFPMNNPDHLAG